MTNNQTEKLNKAYKKSFKALNKNFFKQKNVGLLLFVDYLRYLRDSLALTTEDDVDIKLRLATINAAIAEFEAYNKSSNNANDTQKAFHWANFCELFKQNMEEWLE
jgi:hypothetical protein